MTDLWTRREEAIADARRRREEYWREHNALEQRLRRETNELFNSAMARLQTPAEALTPEERLAKFVEILMEEVGKLGTPLPVPVARVGVSGVDRQAQKLLAERGVQRVQGPVPTELVIGRNMFAAASSRRASVRRRGP
jgi:hypothetical protein